MNSATLQAKKAQQSEKNSENLQTVYFLDVGKEEIRNLNHGFTSVFDQEN